MNYTRVKRISCLLVTLVGILFSVSLVAASDAYAVTELDLPDELIHAGLTFTAPLHYSNDSHISEVKTITFMTEDTENSSEETTTSEVIVKDEELEPTLLVQATSKEEVFAEEIVLPTPKKETPSPTPTKKLTPTIQPSKNETPTPVTSTTPTTTPQVTTSASLPSYATNGTLSADVLFSMVNQKRADAGLPAFEKQGDVCSVAEARKGQIENEVYGNSSIHAGFRAMDIPFRASENMISQNSEAEAMNWWMNSPIHKAGILGASKYACVVCQNKTCSMIMSSLDPK